MTYVTGVVGTVQLALSGASLAAGWDDAYAASKDAQLHSTRLSDEYKKLAEKLGQGGVTDLQRADYERRLELLDVEKTFRDQTDLKMNTTNKELRLGMRSALHQFQRTCITCKKIPSVRNPSDCETCGR
jgi:mobilome CxxCx(11)CxxC protein